MRKSKLLVGLSVVGLAIGAAIPAAMAVPQNVVCNGSIGAIDVDNVEVPEFGRCVLNGTRVLGSIDVYPSARLSATAVTVAGNVQGSGATSVVVARSTVRGSVAVVQGGVARVTGSAIGGDILVDSQRGAVTVSNNRVGTGVAGNVEIFANLGGTTINLNRIAGNLACKDNLPAPIGSGNVVGGNKEDQCLNL